MRCPVLARGREERSVAGCATIVRKSERRCKAVLLSYDSSYNKSNPIRSVLMDAFCYSAPIAFTLHARASFKARE